MHRKRGRYIISCKEEQDPRSPHYLPSRLRPQGTRKFASRSPQVASHCWLLANANSPQGCVGFPEGIAYFKHIIREVLLCAVLYLILCVADECAGEQP